mgnify:FL=1
MISIFEKDMRFPILLDAYGDMLSERKREILDYYYNEDYSLSEISELTGISRQGVRDSIKKSEYELHELENKLGIVKKNEHFSYLIKKAAALLESEINSSDVASKECLSDILGIINEAIKSADISYPQEK